MSGFEISYAILCTLLVCESLSIHRIFRGTVRAQREYSRRRHEAAEMRIQQIRGNGPRIGSKIPGFSALILGSRERATDADLLGQSTAFLFFNELPEKLIPLLRSWLDSSVPKMRETVDGAVFVVFCGRCGAGMKDVIHDAEGEWCTDRVKRIIDEDYRFADAFDVRVFPAIVLANAQGEIVESGTAVGGVLENRWAQALPTTLSSLR